MAAAVASSSTEGSVVRGIGFALLSYASFSTADAAVKVASGRLSVFEIAAILALFALLPVLTLTRGRGGLAALKPKLWGLVVTRSVLTAFCAVCAWKAFALLPLADAYAILVLKARARTVRSESRDAEDLWRCLEIAAADGVTPDFVPATIPTACE